MALLVAHHECIMAARIHLRHYGYPWMSQILLVEDRR
jgi:hypothetical protein